MTSPTSGEELDYESFTRRHYRSKSTAEEYARRHERGLKSRILAWLEIRAIRRGLADVGVQPGAKVLDIPVGTGKLTDFLRSLQLVPLSADISIEMLTQGSPERPMISDVTAVPLRSSSLDVAVSLRLFHRVPTPVLEAGLGELCRVARSGIVVFYAGHPPLDFARRWFHSVAKRGYEWNMLEPAEVAALLPEGWTVRSDRPIAPAYLTGRVAVAMPNT